MKILFLNQTYFPDKAGTAQQLSQLATDLVAAGHQVTIVCARRSYENPDVQHPKKEVVRGVRVERVGSTGFGKASFLGRFLDGFSFELGILWRMLWVGHHDVVVSFTSPPLVGFGGTLFARRWGALNVQWLMDIHPNIAIAVGYLRRKSVISWFLLGVLRFILRRSDAVIVLDTFMKKVAIEHGAKPEAVEIIPPWLPEGFSMPAAPPEHQNEFRTSHGLADKFVVLYSGNHSVVHPLQTLLEAARCLRDQEHIRFLFVGGGVRKQEVGEFAAEHELPNIVELPYQPKEVLPQSLAAGDLHVVILGDAVNGLVHPSKIYGVMAAGRPYLFLGPEGSHIGELLTVCPGGVQADHGDPKRVAQVILEMSQRSEKDRRVMGQRNLDYLKRHHTNKDCAGLFTRLVLSRLEQPSSDSLEPSKVG